ncbi:MAG: GtrA family protein [Candidatus Pedobacter colombiensis]|uniref:GtrA family protein n=1 Tax=Candidatus Pedobacter colombiensis TaxID=3121371 RepID=A0AAJ5W571_9SPHI|nr:GtrA family protein [Pedobacter sp.]WEK17780.1 MAG: GtrA family protein [Pedobacter sp.]
MQFSGHNKVVRIDRFLSKEKLIQLIKFGIVGCSGLVIDFAITYFFKEYVGLNRFIANALGFSAAVTNNYFIHRFWTFKSDERQIAKQFLKFLIVSVIGLGINTLCIYTIQQWTYLSFYVAKFIAILLVFMWNYTLNALVTFKKNEI